MWLRIGCAAYRQPLLYNLSVTREFLKQVYVAERLQPPTSFSTVTSAYSTIWSRARNPTYWRELFRSGDWTKLGIYAVEAYGIFKASIFDFCGYSFTRLSVFIHCRMLANIVSRDIDWWNRRTKKSRRIQRSIIVSDCSTLSSYSRRKIHIDIRWTVTFECRFPARSYCHGCSFRILRSLLVGYLCLLGWRNDQGLWVLDHSLHRRSVQTFCSFRSRSLILSSSDSYPSGEGFIVHWGDLRMTFRTAKPYAIWY